MKEEYVKQTLEDIKALEKVQTENINVTPPDPSPIYARLLLMIYDEIGTITETQRHLVDAMYDLIGAIKKEE